MLFRSVCFFAVRFLWFFALVATLLLSLLPSRSVLLRFSVNFIICLSPLTAVLRISRQFFRLRSTRFLLYSVPASMFPSHRFSVLLSLLSRRLWLLACCSSVVFRHHLTQALSNVLHSASLFLITTDVTM